MKTRTALIAGGGIGGLAAGICLRRAGWRVRIFEKMVRPREVGFALNLAANAVVALEELGVAEPVVAGGHRTERAEIRRADGRVLKRVWLPAAIGGARAIVATRPTLHGSLLDALGAEDLVTGREVVGFESGSAEVSVVLADGSRESGNVLVGADGVGSVIRRQLHPHEGPALPSGYCALRGVAHEASHLMGEVSAATYLGPGIEASLARTGTRDLYWYMSVLDREVPPRASPRELAAQFVSRLDGLFLDVVQRTRTDAMRFDRLFDRDPLTIWGQGNVTLLGDAAHPMLPHTGQGAAQALEDAVALGLALTRADEVPAALQRYERVRSARTRRLVARGRRAARAMTTHNVVTTGARTALIRLVPAARMARMFMLAGEADPHRELR